MNLSEKKRTIFIILGVIILGVFGFLAYRYLLPDLIVRPQGTSDGRAGGGVGQSPIPEGIGEEESREGEEPSETPPSPQEQTLTQLTAFPVIGPRLNREQTEIWFYKKDGGDLFSSDFSGQNQKKISNITIVGLFDAKANPAANRSALFYLDGETKKAFLHIGTSTTASLPENIVSFSWDPAGASLAYGTRSRNRLNLTLANRDAGGRQTVFSTPLLDARIQWISSSRIAFQTAPSGLAEGFVFLYSRTNGAFDRIIGPLFGLMTLWSPDGERVLASHTDSGGDNLQFSARNAQGAIVFTPPFQTLPEKCAWASGQVFYCAAPGFIPAGTLLPDEYLRGEFNSVDRLFRVDLANGSAREIPLERSFDANDLLLTKNEDYLFFVNRADGTLWSLKLK